MPPTAHPWVDPDLSLSFPGITRTIRLEPLEQRHAADFIEEADPQLFVHTSQGPSDWSVAGFEREIESVRNLPGVVAFAMILADGKQAGRAIGRTTYMDIKPEHRGLEIGRTWIARRFHGTRVNPEAKYMMFRHAFEHLSPAAIRVQITANAANLHSQAAIQKLGAVKEGVLRNCRILQSSPWRAEPTVRDWVYFSVLADEWPSVKHKLEQRLS